MSTTVFPTLTGQAWSVIRTEMWKSRRQENVSGKEVRLSDWSYPRHQWAVTFEMLRQAGTNMQAPSFMGSTFGEMAQLSAFFNNLSGAFDSFLYADPDDNTVTGQTIAVGDGTTKAFQLSRNFGGYQEPIFAPNLGATLHVYFGSTLQGSGYVVNPWGTTDLINGPGAVVFTVAPPVSTVIKVDFSWYFPCHFDDDSMSFEKFMGALYQMQKTTFSGIK